ncbi:hypothetical protein D915_011108 [Fasciola hepatica]|uniref:Uncharacterized protein n=1 Tax=Fasciola hepatica TaxID=6192 RepID=A0A4E0RA36_FASHE|nr:hypothetical protein D915_011108 [Fasciola hepatica]
MLGHTFIAFSLTIALTTGLPNESIKRSAELKREECERKFPECQFIHEITEIPRENRVPTFVRHESKDSFTLCEILLKRCESEDKSQRVQRRSLRMLRLG